MDTASPIPHQERNYTKAGGGHYFLPSDEPERVRLDAQHKAITRRFDNKLVLSPVSLEGGDQVLDCGAGACSWLLDFSGTVSSDIEIYGCDIETNLFPKEHPPNIKLFNASVVDLPKDWADKFQLVHQRLLIGALIQNQWNLALKELFRVTKPGGWIDLCEIEYVLICPAAPNHKSVQMFNAVPKMMDYNKDIALELPGRLREIGFIDIQSIQADYPIGKWGGEDGELAHAAVSGFLKGLKTPILKKGGYGIVQSEEEFDEVMDEFARISNETSGTMCRYHTVYARKPLVADSDTARN